MWLARYQVVIMKLDTLLAPEAAQHLFGPPPQLTQAKTCVHHYTFHLTRNHRRVQLERLPPI